MRNVLINSWAVIGIVSAVVTVSLTTSDPKWFGRAGSIANVFGLLLLIKHGVLCEDKINEPGDES